METYYGQAPKDVSQCGRTFLIETERTITQKGLDESATQLIPPFARLSLLAVRRPVAWLFRTRNGDEPDLLCFKSMTDTPFTLYCHLRDQMENLGSLRTRFRL